MNSVLRRAALPLEPITTRRWSVTETKLLRPYVSRGDNRIMARARFNCGGYSLSGAVANCLREASHPISTDERFHMCCGRVMSRSTWLARPKLRTQRPVGFLQHCPKRPGSRIKADWMMLQDRWFHDAWWLFMLADGCWRCFMVDRIYMLVCDGYLPLLSVAYIMNANYGSLWLTANVRWWWCRLASLCNNTHVTIYHYRPLFTWLPNNVSPLVIIKHDLIIITNIYLPFTIFHHH